MNKYVPATPSEMRVLLKMANLTPFEAAIITEIPARNILDHLQGVKPLSVDEWRLLTETLNI